VRGSVDEHNPYWSQSTVTVTLPVAVSSLKVAVTIQQTGGVANAGTWSTIGNQAVAAVGSSSTAVDYEFTLATGVPLPPGQYSFGVQYNHPAGRSTAHDLYAVVTVASATGTQQGAGGHF
jgi:hypothetical protein